MWGMLLATMSLLLMGIGFRQSLVAPATSAPPAFLAGLLSGVIAIPMQMPMWFRVAHLTGAGLLLAVYFLSYRRAWHVRPDLADDPHVEFSVAGIGDNPNHLTLSADGGMAYVTALKGGTLTAVDLAAREVRGQVKLGKQAADVLALPDGRVLVSVMGGRGRLVVVDVQEGTVTPVEGVGMSRGMALSRDGSHVYVTSMSHDRVHLLAVDTLTVTATVPVGKRPNAVQVSRDGRLLYISVFASDAVKVIDVSTSETIATIAVGDRPRALSLNPDGDLLYVACMDGLFAVIDTNTLRAHRIKPQTWPGDIAAGQDVCYISDASHGTITVFEPGLTSAVTAVKLGPRAPFPLAVAPDGRVYAACQHDSTLVCVRTSAR
ncbi:MAG: YncE family protein [Hamadaea sp.]|nr:YncE family protein [Hamadaea sp.]